MTRFACPDCNRFLGETDGSYLEAPCRSCRKGVFAVALPMQMALECTQCGRRKHLERPRSVNEYCTACGHTTLTSVRTEAPQGAHVPAIRGDPHD